MYYWILIKTADNKYLGWSKSKTEPANGDTDNLSWISYTDSDGNPRYLPEEFDEDSTYYWDADNDYFTDDNGNTYSPVAL